MTIFRNSGDSTEILGLKKRKGTISPPVIFTTLVLQNWSCKKIRKHARAIILVGNKTSQLFIIVPNDNHVYFYRIVKSYNIITTRRLLAYLTLSLWSNAALQTRPHSRKGNNCLCKICRGGMAALDPTMMTTGEKFHII